VRVLRPGGPSTIYGTIQAGTNGRHPEQFAEAKKFVATGAEGRYYQHQPPQNTNNCYTIVTPASSRFCRLTADGGGCATSTRPQQRALISRDAGQQRAPHPMVFERRPHTTPAPRSIRPGRSRSQIDPRDRSCPPNGRPRDKRDDLMVSPFTSASCASVFELKIGQSGGDRRRRQRPWCGRGHCAPRDPDYRISMDVSGMPHQHRG
jgi:hypothetical protein